MTSEELIEALALTGTGPQKLEIARIALRNHKLDPKELLALMAEPDPSTGRALWPEGTCEKARLMLEEGRKPADFQGAPPPMGKEASEERLGRIIAEQMGRMMQRMHGTIEDKQAEAEALNIGRPVKPSEKEGPPPARIDMPQSERPGGHSGDQPSIREVKQPERAPVPVRGPDQSERDVKHPERSEKDRGPGVPHVERKDESKPGKKN